MTGEQPAPMANQSAEATRTLLVRPASPGWRRALTAFHSSWEVSEGGVTVASAYTRMTTYDVEIETSGRRLKLSMPKDGLLGPKRLDVVGTGSGRQVMTGALRSGGRGSNNLVAEEWSLTLASGGAIIWRYWHAKGVLGFYDSQGSPVLLVGHDPSFELPSKPSTLRILLRMWSGAVASVDSYVAQVTTGAVGRLLPEADVPVLAVLAFWLERTADGRYPSSG